MAAVYSNKFIVESCDSVIRMVFVDERVSIVQGIPASQSTISEVVMLKSNAIQLADLIKQLAK